LSLVVGNQWRGGLNLPVIGIYSLNNLLFSLSSVYFLSFGIIFVGFKILVAVFDGAEFGVRTEDRGVCDLYSRFDFLFGDLVGQRISGPRLGC
jgi:hypothetical protein